jgi:hypothetical protein
MTSAKRTLGKKEWCERKGSKFPQRRQILEKKRLETDLPFSLSIPPTLEFECRYKLP